MNPASDFKENTGLNVKDISGSEAQRLSANTAETKQPARFGNIHALPIPYAFKLCRWFLEAGINGMLMLVPADFNCQKTKKF